MFNYECIEFNLQFLFMEHKSSPMSESGSSNVVATNAGGTSIPSTPNKKSQKNGGLVALIYEMICTNLKT